MISRIKFSFRSCEKCRKYFSEIPQNGAKYFYFRKMMTTFAIQVKQFFEKKMNCKCEHVFLLALLCDTIQNRYLFQSIEFKDDFYWF